MRGLIAMVFLCGCADTGVDSGAPPAESASSDGDGDGWSAEKDCDDGAASVHPGASEVPYDGVDQDCDGSDLDDVDGDGWALSEDCDDADAAAYPGASEVPYDGVDQDCDGSDLDDVDGDGWGLSEDCDDLDPSIHPGAIDEPEDGVDQDCDGADAEVPRGCDPLALTGDLDLGEVPVGNYGVEGTWDHGDIGARVVAGFDYDGDGLSDVAVAAPNVGGVLEGMVYVFTNWPADWWALISR